MGTEHWTLNDAQCATNFKWFFVDFDRIIYALVNNNWIFKTFNEDFDQTINKIDAEQDNQFGAQTYLRAHRINYI